MILTRPPSRQDRQNTLGRWLKFNLVGAMGVVVQLGMLHFFTSDLGANYLLATALAVEAAVLHNFVWHERFTWADRAGLTGRGGLDRLLRFNLTTGVISVTGNLILMSLLVEQAHLPFLAANLVTIAFCSLANFVVSDRFVFRSGARGFQRELASAAPEPCKTRRGPRVRSGAQPPLPLTQAGRLLSMTSEPSRTRVLSDIMLAQGVFKRGRAPRSLLGPNLGTCSYTVTVLRCALYDEEANPDHQR